MKNPKRSIQIRRKDPKTDATLQIDAIKAIVAKELEGIRRDILILQSNSHTASVLLRDIYNSAGLADSLSSSTKAKLEEFLTSMQISRTNLDFLIEISEENFDDIGNKTKLDTNRWNASETEAELEQEILAFNRRNNLSDDDETDDIIENLSEDDWPGAL